MVTCTGHIGINEGADGRTDVDDVMAIKPNFLTSMSYHIFLTMVLRGRSSAIISHTAGPSPPPPSPLSVLLERQKKIENLIFKGGEGRGSGKGLNSGYGGYWKLEKMFFMKVSQQFCNSCSFLSC